MGGAKTSACLRLESVVVESGDGSSSSSSTEKIFGSRIMAGGHSGTVVGFVRCHGTCENRRNEGSDKFRGCSALCGCQLWFWVFVLC